jgi:uncharacterized cupin superfamily protein
MKSFNVHDATFEYDDEDPEGYRSGSKRLAPELDGKRMGATVYEIPPNQSLCPYHYETEEEWLMVLEGEITLRHPDGEDVLTAGDVVAFPASPAGAHKATNHGGETARLMMWSTQDPSGYCVYPDSEKILYWAEGTPSQRRKIGPALDYYVDEPLP